MRELRPPFKCPESGNVYHGEWLGEVKDGKGTQTWVATGTVYTGEWRNNVPHGQGKFTKMNGDVHEGNCVKGRAEGYGCFNQVGREG